MRPRNHRQRRPALSRQRRSGTRTRNLGTRARGACCSRSPGLRWRDRCGSV